MLKSQFQHQQKPLVISGTTYGGRSDNPKCVSILDVGCGYGGLFTYLKERKINIKYTGIDVAENMIEYARDNHSEASFVYTDIFEYNPELSFDYVVCNGILTQKLSASIQEMDVYAQRLVEKLFSLCVKGAAFNVM